MFAGTLLAPCMATFGLSVAESGALLARRCSARPAGSPFAAGNDARVCSGAAKRRQGLPDTGTQNWQACGVETYKQQFIEFMVRSEVLTFGDFVTKSGRSTPYFVNTGKYRTGMQMERLGEFYADSIEAFRKRVRARESTYCSAPPTRAFR